ncbi:flagellar biosynthesis protein FlhB [bacterium]|nr:flagellar biosynthesis protein FlhB [bacterium]
MAMFEGSDEERTESATAFRREEFRKQGSVAISREVITVAILLSVLGALSFSMPRAYQEMAGLIRQYFSFEKAVKEFGKADLLVLKNEVGISFFSIVAPVFIVSVIAAFVGCAAQVGLYVTWEPLSPKWERINPISGLQRLLSSKGLVEAFKSILKMGLVGWIVWKFGAGQLNTLTTLLSQSPGEEIRIILDLLSRLLIWIVGAYAFVAAADYGFQKFSLEKQMRMTRREIKEEFKLREGDPLIKSRIRGIQKRLASRRMMEEVPKATVIVTNPTHLAVALFYENGMSAPKVVAKGAGFIADKIRELAKGAGVPIVENKPLARTLFKNIKLGHPIPKELYKAVAEVLAYVFKLKGSRQAA